jgi:formylglycine-generating enzyme required for sulfatase activity
MAVLVVGLETDAASDAFAASIKYEYTQKGYTMASDAVVLAKQTELRNRHKQNPPVDTAGLAAWGKTNSIDFVQLVVETSSALTISGRDQVAQVVSCGTTKYTGRPYYRMRFAAQGTVPCECECEGRLEGLIGEMVSVAGGVFQMGCVSGRDGSCNSDETSHWVQVSSFKIGTYAVTQRLWDEVMGDLPDDLNSISTYQGFRKPVIYVSWDDITGSGGFLEKLNARTGKNYRLPTEAEWEYAARGCNAGVCESYVYSGSRSVGSVAYYYSSNGPTTVGTKSPNGLGLYDMSGNVNEWCSDWYDQYYGAGSSSALSSTTRAKPIVNPAGASSGYYRVLRGGNWSHDASISRVAYRYINTPNPDSPSYRYNKFGFRLV